MEEHKILLRFAGELAKVAQGIKKMESLEAASGEMERVRRLEEHFKDSESHYAREENILFPYLEKHGITQPPAIMWMEHDNIRAVKKNFYSLMEAPASMDFRDFAGQLAEGALTLAELLQDHFHKENNILFPASLRVITEDEWVDTRRQFDELGYPRFTPEEARTGLKEPETIEGATPEPEIAEMEGMVALETGTLSREALEALLNTLPVEITFVDKEDTVRYINQQPEKIFPRTKAVIGRKVQLCHPRKSVHLVNQMIEDFRSGRRDLAPLTASFAAAEVGGFGGPLLLGFLRDATGSLTPGVLLLAAVTAALILIMPFIQERRSGESRAEAIPRS